MNSILCTHIPNIKKILIDVKTNSQFVRVNDKIIGSKQQIDENDQESSP